MSVLDFVEAWWLSVRAILEAAGVVIRFERSPADRLNPSCSLNLRHDELEADLLVWDSGEAELAIVEASGSVNKSTSMIFEIRRILVGHFQGIGRVRGRPRDIIPRDNPNYIEHERRRGGDHENFPNCAAYSQRTLASDHGRR